MNNKKTEDKLWEEGKEAYLDMQKQLLLSLNMLYEVLRPVLPEGNRILAKDKMRRMKKLLDEYNDSDDA